MSLSYLSEASALIEQRTGLAASTQFRADLDGILYNLAEGNLEAFVKKLRNATENDLYWQQLINALTIGETYFFRDPTHFRVLKRHILPELIEKRRRQNHLTLNIWSVGCATGEEPYSIAITLHEHLGADLENWTIRLFGTDINEHALDLARQGFYRQWSFRQQNTLNGDFQEHYFELDPVENKPQIKRHIQEMVTFRTTNLLNGPPLPQLDIIFCRNVLIYFKNPLVEKVEDMFFDVLSPGGWLLLGQSEAIRHLRERWVTHLFPGSAIYQKPKTALTLPEGQFAYRQHTQPALEVTHTQEVAVVRVPKYGDAVAAVQRDDLDMAEQLLGEILIHEPDHAGAHMLLGSIFANRRALPEAQAHIDTALKIDGLQADAHYLQAMLHLENGDFDAAKKALNSALYCQRNHPLAAFVLGNLYAQDGDIARANRMWSSARAALTNLKPDSPISDMSELTAEQLTAMFDSQLDGWEK